MSTDWTAAEIPALDGEVVVVTGANSGIGYEVTKALARRGATVVLACRSVVRGETAAAEIRRAGADGALDVRKCDLASLVSVASFADSFTSDYDELRILCNNAGIMAIPRSETADGFETQFGVNHLGHFALTGHLLDTLAKTPGESRVVTQSSTAHGTGTIDFDDLQHERSYSKWGAYGQSKLANVLFGYELDRQLDAHHVEDLLSAVCHPGYSETNLQIRTGEASGSRLLLWAMKAVNLLVGQPAEMGALPMLYAATSDEMTGGEYVGPGGLLNMRGHPEFQRSNDESYDETVATRLWAVSEDLAGVEYEFGSLAPTPE